MNYLVYKKCCYCKLTLDIGLFYKRKSTNKPISICKKCFSEKTKIKRNKNKDIINKKRREDRKKNPQKYKKYEKDNYQRNKLKIKERNEKYKEKNKEFVKNYKKEWAEKNKDRLKKIKKIYQIENKEKIYFSRKIYREKNKKIIIAKKKKYYEKNKEKINKKILERHNDRYKTDKEYKLKKIIRARFRCFLKRKNILKKHLTNYYIGHSLEEYINHFKNQEISLELYLLNSDKYEIDHIIPCCLYDHYDIKEIKKCYDPKNLRIISSLENNKKGGKLDFDLIKKHKIQHLLPKGINCELS